MNGFLTLGLVIQLTAGADPSAFSPSAANPSSEIRNAFVAVTVERHALPQLKGSLSFRLDALGAAVELVAPKDAAILARWFEKNRSTLCGRVELVSPSVRLTCSTRLLDAALSLERGRYVLHINELRGLPWHLGDDSAPMLAFLPEGLGLGGPCPGTTPAGEGECARLAGESAKANGLFKRALATGDSQFAAIRLGDQALAENDDPVAAVEWYRKSGYRELFGRLGQARLCEVTGTCFTTDAERVFDSSAMPEPVRTELELRLVRLHAFTGSLTDAIGKLIARLNAPGRIEIPPEGLTFCRRLALEALRSADPELKKLGLEVFVRVRAADHKERRDRVLTRAAADASAYLGAPLYGANLMALMTNAVGRGELEDHLLHTTRLYLDANDDVRASVITDFAKTVLGPKVLLRPAWKTILSAVSHDSQRARRELLIDENDIKRIDAERASAEALLAKVRAQLEAPSPEEEKP